MRLLRSLSFRLAMIYVALFCASVAALLGIYYWMSVHAPLERAKEQVNAEAQALAQTYILDGGEVLTRQLEKRAVAPAHRKAFHAFIAGNGRVVTSNLPSWPQTIGSGWLRFEADTFHDGEEVDHEALVLDRRFDDGARLLIGRDIENIDDIEEHIQSAAAWMLGGAILIGLLGGMLMSNAIDKRIDAVNSAARRVISGDLSGRIATRGSGDDFDRLGETLNLMLERIETLLESVRRVSDSVAHELRTPLQRLLVTLEELETVDEPDRRTSLCAEAIQEAQRLRHIFDALLRIARIEGGRHSAGKHAFDLSELAEDAVDSYRPDADEKGIRLLADLTPAEVIGDPDLVFQALSNLIENALKYASAGAEILVRVGNDNGQRLIAVIDNGPGVAREDIAHLTERFYRAEGTNHLPGEGLGLSLVAAIANAHHAELRFRDNHPGLIVELAFPES
jgi:signal transduction histidine kinase